MNKERIKYVCNNCSYEFSRNNEVNFLHCPYCGKKGTVDIKKGDFASKVLDEVSNYS